MSGGHHIRNRLRSNASDASSTDDLDGSFNSGVSPAGVSTTVFNYNTLKDQLNSPAKRNIATTKWCQNSAAVTAQENNMTAAKLRSSSASNIVVLDPPTLPDPNATTTKTHDRARKVALSRSRSIEVIVDNMIVERNGDDYSVDRLSLESGRFASTISSKSCDRLDYDPAPTSSFFLNDNDDDLSNNNNNRTTVNILSVTLSKNVNKENISVVRLDESVKAKIEIQTSGVLFADSSESHDTHFNCTNSQAGNTSFNRINSNENTIVNCAESQMNNDFSSESRENVTEFNNRHSGNCQRTLNLINCSINEEDEKNDCSNHFNTSHQNSLSAFLSSQADLSGLSGNSESSTLFGEDSTDEGRSTLHQNECSILEDIAEREDDDAMLTSPSLDSAGNGMAISSSVTISLDDSYLDENDEEGRRSTMDSQGTINSSHDGKSDVFSMDRSITTDSMNSIATSDTSQQSPDDCESSQTHAGVVHSHSDEAIAKRSGDMDAITLPPKSASLSEKKSGISPYFRRKKSKDKDSSSSKKDKQDRKLKARSMCDVLSDEPVLVSIKETGDGRMVFDESSKLYESVVPTSFSIDVVEKKKGVETASIPIPVPASAHDVKKSSPSAATGSATDPIPKRKRSLYLREVFKKVSVRRANSEQSLLDIIPPSPSKQDPGMKPAFSSIEINGSANGHLLKSNIPNNISLNTTNNNNPDFEIGTRSLERIKKNTSLRERFSMFTQLSSSEVDIHKASGGGSGMDSKSSLKKEKKKLKAGSLRIISATPRESTNISNGSNGPRRKTSMLEPSRPQFVTRKSISINRGPLKIMSIFKHWLAKHPKVRLHFCL